MAIKFANVRFKQGNFVDLPVAVSGTSGEPRFCLDTGQFFISDGTQNIEITPNTTNIISGGGVLYSQLTSTSGVLQDQITTYSDHGNLAGIEDDDHLQYVPTDGRRGFTGTVSGITPTQDYDLTTKDYVDEEISTLSGTLSDSTPFIQDGDVYFYDSTRSKNLGTALLQIDAGRNSTNTTTQYLRTTGSVAMNRGGRPLPYDATLVGMTMSGAVNTQTWTIQVRKNGTTTTLTTLTIINAYENHTWAEDIDFSEGDRVQIRMTGTNINYPQATLYFRRRL